MGESYKTNPFRTGAEAPPPRPDRPPPWPAPSGLAYPPAATGKAAEPPDASGWNGPTVDDLNEDTDREFDWTGVNDTTEEDSARVAPDTAAGRELARPDEQRLRELGLCRMIVMDVRGDPESDEERGRRRR